MASLLDTAAELERRLPLVKGDVVAADSLTNEVRRRIQERARRGGHEDAADPVATVPTHQAGVRLWNLVLRLARDAELSSTMAIAAPLAATTATTTAITTAITTAAQAYRRLLLHSRVFAFLIIDSSNSAGQPSTLDRADTPDASQRARLVYCMGIAARAARMCVGDGDIVLGRVVLDKAATYQVRLHRADAQSPNPETNADDNTQAVKVQRLEAELSLWQTVQLWKENKHCEAERCFMDNEACILHKTLDAAHAGIFAAALFDIGKGLLLDRKAAEASLWLNRAGTILSKQLQTLLSDEAKALHISITHALAVASLDLETPEGYKRATELVEQLCTEAGEDDPRVQLARLELSGSSMCETFDAVGYKDVLVRMVKGFDGTTEAFLLLRHHIQTLHNKSPGLGCDVLDEFLLSLRYRDDAIAWVEKLVIARVWLLAQQRESQEGLDKAERVLSKLRMPISPDTAVAAQTLMWKRIEQGYQDKDYSTAVRWCRLALCHIFEAGARVNRALIERKLLLCSIESGELDAAKSAYLAMAESTQDESMTKYLLFKLSILADDLDLATDCLRSISTSVNGRELLFACTLHARHAKAPRFVVQALKKLADTINHGDPGPVHTPALFRCIILMLQDMIDDAAKRIEGNPNDEEALSQQEMAVHDIVAIFDGVVKAVEISRNGPPTNAEKPVFTIGELEWFCRAAYNLGLKYSGFWDLRCTMGILETCVRIIKLFPTGQELEVAVDMTNKRLNCHFLVASALAALARMPTTACPDTTITPGEQAQRDYQVMREHIKSFQTTLKQSGYLGVGNGKKPQAIEDQFQSKLPILLIFDFEGAIALGDWDELESICERAVPCQNASTFRVLGDCLLRFQMTVPSKKFVSTMRYIVNKLKEIANFGSGQLVKYYRCLFQAALYRDNDAAFRLLDEVCRLVQNDTIDGLDLGDDSTTGAEEWPEDELQFLAVTAFNEGIDWFAGGREDQARQWALAATRLAGRCRDGGQLKRQICERFALLKLGDLEVKTSVETDVLDDAGLLSSSVDV